MISFELKVEFKGTTIMTSMCPIMPIMLWQSSAVSSISPLGPVCAGSIRVLSWPNPGLHLVSMCPTKHHLYRAERLEKAVKSKVFDAKAEDVLTECCVSMEVETLLMCPSHFCEHDISQIWHECPMKQGRAD